MRITVTDDDGNVLDSTWLDAAAVARLDAIAASLPRGLDMQLADLLTRRPVREAAQREEG